MWIDGRQQAAEASICLLVGPKKFPVTALVLNAIAGKIFSQSIHVKQLKSMKREAIADNIFHRPGTVQLLLGADVHEDLFLDERKNIMDCLIANLSSPGWLLKCCPICVPTNTNPSRLQWNGTLLASRK